MNSTGGVIIYLHEKYEHVHKLKINKYAIWEGQIIEVKRGDILDKPIYIENIYRRPTKTFEFYEFIYEFSPILK